MQCILLQPPAKSHNDVHGLLARRRPPLDWINQFGSISESCVRSGPFSRPTRPVCWPNRAAHNLADLPSPSSPPPTPHQLTANRFPPFPPTAPPLDCCPRRAYTHWALWECEPVRPKIDARGWNPDGQSVKRCPGTLWGEGRGGGGGGGGGGPGKMFLGLLPHKFSCFKSVPVPREEHNAWWSRAEQSCQVLVIEKFQNLFIIRKNGLILL